MIEVAKELESVITDIPFHIISNTFWNLELLILYSGIAVRGPFLLIYIGNVDF